MPRNPSYNQIIASRRNLKGNYGPKTLEGKKISSSNGKNNTGAKNAASRARVINGRWKSNTTLYAAAGCHYCKTECDKKSFSYKTNLSELNLRCLRRVITDDPEKCFYFFDGICCIHLSDAANCNFIDDICILEKIIYYDNLSIGKIDPSYYDKFELIDRKKNISNKLEMIKYLNTIRNKGITKAQYTPRMKFIIKYFQGKFINMKYCSILPYKNYNEMDETLRKILEEMT